MRSAKHMADTFVEMFWTDMGNIPSINEKLTSIITKAQREALEHAMKIIDDHSYVCEDLCKVSSKPTCPVAFYNAIQAEAKKIK